MNVTDDRQTAEKANVNDYSKMILVSVTQYTLLLMEIAVPSVCLSVSNALELCVNRGCFEDTT